MTIGRPCAECEASAAMHYSPVQKRLPGTMTILTLTHSSCRAMPRVSVLLPSYIIGDDLHCWQADVSTSSCPWLPVPKHPVGQTSLDHHPIVSKRSCSDSPCGL